MTKRNIVCIFLTAICFFSTISFVGSQQEKVRPLILDEQNTKIWNRETMQSWTYAEFVNLSEEERIFNAGEDFLFDIVLINTLGSSSIPIEYRINLYTSLDNPIWTYRDNTKKDNAWIIWNTSLEHNIREIRIKLEGKIPKPVWNVTEPHFEDMELLGIVQRELYIQINVTDGVQTIQELTRNLTLHATDENLKGYMEETKGVGLAQTNAKMNEAFEGSSSAVSKLSNLREKIIRLAEEGHPGWAYDLSQDLEAFDEAMGELEPVPPPSCPPCPPCPECPSPIIFVIIGLAIGVVSGLLIGRFMGGKKLVVPDLEDQIKKINNIRERIQEIREDESKRKIELLGPETELKDLSRRMDAIKSELDKVRVE